MSFRIQGAWRRLTWTVVALLLCVLNARCTQQHSADLEDEDTARKKIPANVLRDLERGLTTDVVIALEEAEESSDAPLQSMELMPAAMAEPLRDEIVKSRVELYRALQDRVIARAPTRGLRLVKRYENLPILHFEASQLSALVALLQQPEVSGVYEDVRYEHQLTRSLPLIQQPMVAGYGLGGEGTSIAVFDTGCNFTLPEFGSCASAGAPGCKVAYARDFGGDDGSRDDNGHGTNVSAIVLGVAPKTKIIALDVFAGSTARWTDILSAMDWVIANRTTYNIVGVNMSLGGGQYSAPCGGDAMSNAISSARSLGILTAIASGNNGWSQYMSAPGCVPDAISVGATYAANFGGRGYSACSDPTTAADKITCFSNSTSFLSMLAPGALINAAGYTMAGTSQATPHVAGAIAVLRAAFPDESVASTAARLTESGPTITDPRNGVTKHRLDLLAALNGEGIADRTAPSGSIAINGGDSFTRARDVTLTLTGTDNESAVEICVSNNSSECSTFVPFVSSLSWTLQSGDGLKTVYLTLRDASDNQTKVSDAITLDVTPPSGSNLSIVPADGAVYLNWTQASDTASGFERFFLMVADDEPPGCNQGTQLYAGGATSFVHTKLPNGRSYGYRLCLVDKAGNVGEGPSGVGKPAAEHGTPFGAVIINGDAEYANSRDVVLTLTATDTSDAVQICVSNGDTCSDWMPYLPILPWRIDATSGTATVKVWFKDGHGVLSATAVSDSIRVDLDAPSASTLSALTGDAEVQLSWTSSTDAISGLGGYRVVAQLNAAPSCAEGVQIYQGAARSFRHTGLQNGVDYGYRVCSFDLAGNERDGGAAVVRPVPELDPPVGSVEINAGAGYTRETEVTLTLTAADVSGVAEMCVSNTTSCSAWLGYAPFLPWTLDGSSPTARVYVWFRDIYGATSTSPVTASIVLDTTGPTDGQLTAAAQDAAVSVSWSGVTDASGVTGFKLVGQVGEAPSCDSGTVLYTGTGTSFLHSGLENGSVYGYRLCPTDRAGNMGSGPTASARPLPELDAPAGGVLINEGAAYANSVDVTLTLVASDASGVAQMCLSNAPSCDSWLPYAATSSWKLSATAATATVYAWFRDTWGTTTLVPVSDTIVVDKTAPSAGRLDVNAGDAQIQLDWSDVSDDLSGVARYKLVGHAGAAPSCSGPELYTGSERTFVHEGLDNGVVYSYRLCPIDGAGNMASGATGSGTPAPERDAPVGTLVIAGDALYATSADVTVSVSASDASGVAQVCLSNNESCSAWRSYAPSQSWRLDTRSTTATVYAWFRDVYGNTSLVPVSDTIIVDLVAPESGTLSAVPSDSIVTLTWTGASDAVSGVAGYKLVAAEGGVPSCAQGSEIYRGVDTTFAHTGLSNGVAYGYRLCAIDVAGNIGAGTTASARPAPERDGPVGSVVINGGDEYTRLRTVSLQLAATDASQVTEMCISNSSSCSAWISFATTASWNLVGGVEQAEVNVWYRDLYGNVSAMAARDTILVDSTAPSSGTLSGEPGNSQNSLSWTEATDAKSGVASYKLVMALDAIPECDTGTSLYTGSALSYMHSGLENGRSYGYRICASDAAGNVASGPSLVLRPAPERDGPTGSVVINAGALYTRDTAVTLTLAAQDPSGVTEVCISNGTSCLQWRALLPSLPWSLAATGGESTVNVWFKDSYGNVSATPYSDTIILDRTAPQAGALQANPGDASVSLTWADAADMASGIARYDLYAALGAAPNCAGTPVYSGTNKSFTHTGLVNGSSYGYRLCPVDGAGNVGSGATASARPRPETAGPTCTVVINAGAQYTNDANVTLALTATDPSGAPEMCVSEAASCSTWTSASASMSWTLRAQSGAATVNVWFKDSYGNISESPCSDSIVIDKTPPLSGQLTVEAPALDVTLRWTASSDNGSGVVGHKLVASRAELPSCASGSEIYAGTGSSFTHSGLEDGETYFYRLCPIDAAGNVGEGATASLRVISEREGPIGQVQINAGAELTRTRDVTLTISASDPHGVVQMCVANAPHCEAWQPYAATLPWTIDEAADMNPVRVWFKDGFDNVSAQPATDTIVLDEQSPLGGQLFAEPANASVKLTWTGSADSVSGVAGYRVRVSEGEAPSCESGSQIYFGPALSYTHTGLQNGTVYGYRVCAVDRAGNVATGVTASALPKPEFDGPQGSVSIAGGAAYTNTTEVTLTLSAQDASGVAAMCLSNSPTCSNWRAYASSVSWTLGVSSGHAVVYALFRDSFGTVSSSVVSDSIVIDRVAPTTQSFSATAGNGSVSLAWAATDAVSGIAHYRLMAAAQSAPACGEGTPVYQGTGTQFTHSGLQNGTLYAYRLCVVDGAGNLSADRTVSARPAPEFAAPSGSVSINAGAAITDSVEVALGLTAEDASGVAEMCISNGSSCTSWQGFAPNAPWTLDATNGAASVRVWFKDSFGNVSAQPVSDSIVLDTVAPSGGEISAGPRDGEVRVTWTAAADATTSVVTYVLRGALDSAPDCSSDDGELYRGAAMTFVHSGLQNGALYAYRVCPIDAAGNVGDGIVASARPAPEFNPPTGRVYIEAGARVVGGQQVTLTMTANDASAVTHMCLSNTTSCSDWVPFASSSPWTLVSTEGAAVVRAWYRDVYGNAMVVPTSATIIVDMQGPVMGALNTLATPGRVYLSWSAASDVAGVASYTLVRQAGATAPSDCTTGELVYSGTDRATHHNLSPGPYAYRLCATDLVGNKSEGTTRIVTVP